MINALLAIIPKALLAGLLVGALVVAGFQTWRIGGLKEENARFEVAVEQCAATNAQNTKTIDEITGINASCIAGREADEKQHNAALIAWTVERELLKVKANEKADNVIEVFREPTCADFAKVNITSICPGMVDGLRRRAENHNRIRNQNSQGASTDAN